MSHLFFKATGFTSSRDLPQLSGVEPLIPNVENKAYAHWLFGGSASSLVDVVNNKQLTLQPGATINPAYSENGVTISTAYGNSLLSDITDAASQNITMIAVVRCNTTSLAVLLGNLLPTGVNTSSSCGAFASAGKAYATVKPSVSGSGVLNSLTPPASITQTSTFFIAVIVDKVAQKAVIHIEQGAVDSSNEGVFSSTYETSLNKIAVGNNCYTTSATTSNTATYNEVIIFDRALTLAEIQAVATRSKERLANRNVSF